MGCYLLAERTTELQPRLLRRSPGRGARRASNRRPATRTLGQAALHPPPVDHGEACAFTARWDYSPRPGASPTLSWAATWSDGNRIAVQPGTRSKRGPRGCPPRLVTRFRSGRWRPTTREAGTGRASRFLFGQGIRNCIGEGARLGTEVELLLRPRSPPRWATAGVADGAETPCTPWSAAPGADVSSRSL